MSSRAIGFALAVLVLGVFVASRAPIAQAHNAFEPITGSHGADLTRPRVDVLADGKVVVSLDAEGDDLPGTLTLNLTPAGDGSYSGDWAFIVAKVDTTDPDTGLEPSTEEHTDENGEEHHHKDFLRMTPRGTIGGTISHASLAFGPDGLGDVYASLTITTATQEFEGATGSGTASLSSVSFVF
jgi:hypothetical protein